MFIDSFIYIYYAICVIIKRDHIVESKLIDAPI